MAEELAVAGNVPEIAAVGFAGSYSFAYFGLFCTFFYPAPEIVFAGAFQYANGLASGFAQAFVGVIRSPVGARGYASGLPAASLTDRVSFVGDPTVHWDGPAELVQAEFDEFLG